MASQFAKTLQAVNKLYKLQGKKVLKNLKTATTALKSQLGMFKVS